MNNCNFGVVKQVKVLEDTPTTSIEELFYILRTATKEEKILLLDELGILDELRTFITNFTNQNYTLYINELITNFGLNLTLTVLTQNLRIEELTQETNNKVSLSDIEISNINLTPNLELVSTNKLVTVTNSNGDSKLFRLPLLDIVEFVYYTITYLNNPGTSTQRVKENTVVTFPTPSYPEKIFLGWVVDEPYTTGVCLFVVEDNGPISFRMTREANDGNYAAYTSSITVTGSINKTWDFTQLTWNKNQFGNDEISIRDEEENYTYSCIYATDALEGLALQGGSGTSWTVNLNGLSQWNGQRIIVILNVNKGDVVTITTASKITKVFNGIGDIKKIITSKQITNNITLRGLWKDIPKALYYLTNTIPTSVPALNVSNSTSIALKDLVGWNTWHSKYPQYIIVPSKSGKTQVSDYINLKDLFDNSLTASLVIVPSSIDSRTIIKWDGANNLDNTDLNATITFNI